MQTLYYLLGGLGGLLIGAAVSLVNFRLAARWLQGSGTGTGRMMALSAIRMVLSVVCLALAYIAGLHLPCGIYAPLIGAALGLTVPTFLLLGRLSRSGS